MFENYLDLLIVNTGNLCIRLPKNFFVVQNLKFVLVSTQNSRKEVTFILNKTCYRNDLLINNSKSREKKTAFGILS